MPHSYTEGVTARTLTALLVCKGNSAPSRLLFALTNTEHPRKTITHTGWPAPALSLLMQAQAAPLCTLMKHLALAATATVGRTVELQQTGAALYICDRHRRFLRKIPSTTREHLRTSKDEPNAKPEQRYAER